jgi:hypothetical protein
MYAVSKILERIRTRGGQDKHSLFPLILCHLDRSYSDNYISNFSRALYILSEYRNYLREGVVSKERHNLKTYLWPHL